MLEIGFTLQAGIIFLRAKDSNVLSLPSTIPFALIKIFMGRRGGVSAIFGEFYTFVISLEGKIKSISVLTWKTVISYNLGHFSYILLKHTHIYEV